MVHVKLNMLAILVLSALTLISSSEGFDLGGLGKVVQKVIPGNHNEYKTCPPLTLVAEAKKKCMAKVNKECKCTDEQMKSDPPCVFMRTCLELFQTSCKDGDGCGISSDKLVVLKLQMPFVACMISSLSPIVIETDCQGEFTGINVDFSGVQDSLLSEFPDILQANYLEAGQELIKIALRCFADVLNIDKKNIDKMDFNFMDITSLVSVFDGFGKMFDNCNADTADQNIVNKIYDAMLCYIYNAQCYCGDEFFGPFCGANRPNAYTTDCQANGLKDQ